MLAACGLVSLNKMVHRLKDDHENAKFLSDSLQKIPKVEVTRPTQINMVFIRITDEKIGDNFVSLMKDKGVLLYPRESGEYRFVCHHGISRDQIIQTINAVKQLLG